MGVCGECVQSARPSSGYDPGFRLERREVATSELDGRSSLEPSTVNEQTSHVPFMVKLNVRVAEACVVEGLHLIETYPVTCERGPWVAVASERSLSNPSVTVAAPRHPPMF